MFRFSRVPFIFLLSIFLFSSQIEAAEIIMLSKRSILIINGKIEPGDYLKFRKALKDEGAPPIYPISLNSPGGDVVEAMKIGRLIRKLKLVTRAPSLFLTKPPKIVCYPGRVESASTSNCTCASACFFIFIAGVGREVFLGRTQLGVHRPYIAPERAKQLTLNKTISEYEGVRKIVVNYLNEMGVPLSYYDKMMIVPSGDIEMLSQKLIDKDFSNDIPAVEEWKLAKCAILTSKENRRLQILTKKNEPLTEIEGEVYNELSEKLMKEFSCGNYLLAGAQDEAYREEFLK